MPDGAFPTTERLFSGDSNVLFDRNRSSACPNLLVDLLTSLRNSERNQILPAKNLLICYIEDHTEDAYKLRIPRKRAHFQDKRLPSEQNDRLPPLQLRSIEVDYLVFAPDL